MFWLDGHSYLNAKHQEMLPRETFAALATDFVQYLLYYSYLLGRTIVDRDSTGEEKARADKPAEPSSSSHGLFAPRAILFVLWLPEHLPALPTM